MKKHELVREIIKVVEESLAEGKVVRSAILVTDRHNLVFSIRNLVEVICERVLDIIEKEVVDNGTQMW